MSISTVEAAPTAIDVPSLESTKEDNMEHVHRKLKSCSIFFFLDKEHFIFGRWQTETKPIPMKGQPQKPNTKPIFIQPKNINI